MCRRPRRDELRGWFRNSSQSAVVQFSEQEERLVIGRGITEIEGYLLIHGSGVNSFVEFPGVDRSTGVGLRGYYFSSFSGLAAIGGISAAAVGLAFQTLQQDGGPDGGLTNT